jgi:hypothetical protein
MSDDADRASNTTWVHAAHEGECFGAPRNDGGWCNHSAHWQRFEAAEKWRANWLPSPHFYNLNQACAQINKAFGGFGCYLVGSCQVKRDYRDVDVRLVLDDAEYERLFRSPGGEARGGWANALWSLMCTSLSLWLKQQTDLPVDFQIQSQTYANANHRGHRSALGIFLDYPGERPTDVAEPATPADPGEPTP